MVALILIEKTRGRPTVNLWKLKAGVGKQLGNRKVYSRSHYQRLKRWLWQEKASPAIWAACNDSNCQSIPELARWANR